MTTPPLQTTQVIKCNGCITKYLVTDAENKNLQNTYEDALELSRRDGTPEPEKPVLKELPGINDAVTWASNWQEKRIGNQVVFQCVVIPSCMDELTPQITPRMQFSGSGLALGAPAMPNGKGQFQG